MVSLIENLKRYPIRKTDLLRAWDAADELMISFAKEQDLDSKRILIINDSFGALAWGLKEFSPVVYSDSYVSHRGILQNSGITSLNSLSQIDGIFDYVFIKLPKNLSFFEDILCVLTGHLHSESMLIFGDMVKHMSKGSFDLINKYIGETTTSLAVKKARLIFAGFHKKIVVSPYPLIVAVEGFEKPFRNGSNIFSREKLDIGTRFFLQHIPEGKFNNILDLGCANGIIGIKAKKLNPTAKIHFSDDSNMAIESAAYNYSQYFDDQSFKHWTNCFETGKESSIDLVLCNPPFHQNNTVGDFIARQMFEDAHHCLNMGGQLRVIGNTHLRYHIHLKNLFGNLEVVASNSKFTIFDSFK